MVLSCVALQCLVVALLWRTGEYSELKSFSLAQETQWIISRKRQLHVPTTNRNYFDNPGSASYAEALVLIATEGCSDNNGEFDRPLLFYLHRNIVR